MEDIPPIFYFRHTLKGSLNEEVFHNNKTFTMINFKHILEGSSNKKIIHN